MKRVLLVDDDEFNRDMVIQLLANSIDIECEFIEAENGLEAVDLAAEIKPDLVLMDLSLPGISGWEATRRIRQMAQDLPIIAITAHVLKGDKDRAMEAGCVDYITKPVDHDELVRKFLAYIN
ncbi:MAG: response regulator [Nitrospinota bacterium]|nr:response regulator [Nitrospinota bacterium]